MGEIFGKKPFRNAVTDSITTINTSIASVTASLDNATQLYNQAITAISTCNNRSGGCLDKTGRHISTWRDQRDRYAPLVEQYKKELQELLALQKALTETQGTTAQATIVTAQAEQAVAEAETAISSAETSKTMSSGLKYGLIIGGVLILVIGGIIAYKKFKK
jgi:chromosome segregation ATPase